MMTPNNPQAVPQAQFAAFANSFVDRGSSSSSTFDSNKFYPKPNAPAFWGSNPFGAPFGMNGSGEGKKHCVNTGTSFDLNFRIESAKRRHRSK
jgi:hypothetical protein